MSAGYAGRVLLGKEPSWGVPASTFIVHPAENPAFNFAAEGVVDNAKRGLPANDFAVFRGVTHSEGGIASPLYVNESGHLIMGITGSDTVSGTADPWTHTFAFTTTPPSYTVLNEDSVLALYEQYVGCMVHEVRIRIRVGEGFTGIEASLQGGNRTTNASANPATVNANIFPLVTNLAICSFAGNSFPVNEAEINITRDIALIYEANPSPISSPRMIMVGPPSVSGRVTMRFATASLLDNFINDTEGAFQIRVVNQFPSPTREFQYTSAKTRMTDGPYEVDRSGVYTTLAFSWRSIYNSTDNGPGRIILLNDRSTAY